LHCRQNLKLGSLEQKYSDCLASFEYLEHLPLSLIERAVAFAIVVVEEGFSVETITTPSGCEVNSRESEKKSHFRKIIILNQDQFYL
jgi:hypothetical protein